MYLLGNVDLKGTHRISLNATLAGLDREVGAACCRSNSAVTDSQADTDDNETENDTNNRTSLKFQSGEVAASEKAENNTESKPGNWKLDFT